MLNIRSIQKSVISFACVALGTGLTFLICYASLQLYLANSLLKKQLNELTLKYIDLYELYINKFNQNIAASQEPIYNDSFGITIMLFFLFFVFFITVWSQSNNSNLSLSKIFHYSPPTPITRPELPDAIQNALDFGVFKNREYMEAIFSRTTYLSYVHQRSQLRVTQKISQFQEMYIRSFDILYRQMPTNQNFERSVPIEDLLAFAWNNVDIALDTINAACEINGNSITSEIVIQGLDRFVRFREFSSPNLVIGGIDGIENSSEFIESSTLVNDNINMIVNNNINQDIYNLSNDVIMSNNLILNSQFLYYYFLVDFLSISCFFSVLASICIFIELLFKFFNKNK